MNSPYGEYNHLKFMTVMMGIKSQPEDYECHFSAEIGKDEVAVAGVTGHHTNGFAGDGWAAEHARETAKFLKANGIEARVVTQTRYQKHPWGTGHKGAVRAFDGWLPSVHYVMTDAEVAGKVRTLLCENGASNGLL